MANFSFEGRNYKTAANLDQSPLIQLPDGRFIKLTAQRNKEIEMVGMTYPDLEHHYAGTVEVVDAKRVGGNKAWPSQRA